MNEPGTGTKKTLEKSGVFLLGEIKKVGLWWDKTTLSRKRKRAFRLYEKP